MVAAGSSIHGSRSQSRSANHRPSIDGKLNSTGNYGRRCLHLYVRICFL